MSMNGRKRAKTPLQLKRWAAGVPALVLVLLAGVLFTWWTVNRSDGLMRADLLQQARLVAQAVSLDRLQALSGTNADLNSPDYRQLKDHLAAMRTANAQCREKLGLAVRKELRRVQPPHPVDNRGGGLCG